MLHAYGIILAVDRICRCQYTASSIQGRVDSSLGYCDGLLLHHLWSTPRIQITQSGHRQVPIETGNLVNSNPVDVAHFVEFVNADYAAVSKYHCASLKSPDNPM